MLATRPCTPGPSVTLSVDVEPAPQDHSEKMGLKASSDESTSGSTKNDGKLETWAKNSCGRSAVLQHGNRYWPGRRRQSRSKRWGRTEGQQRQDDDVEEAPSIPSQSVTETIRPEHVPAEDAVAMDGHGPGGSWCRNERRSWVGIMAKSSGLIGSYMRNSTNLNLGVISIQCPGEVHVLGERAVEQPPGL